MDRLTTQSRPKSTNKGKSPKQWKPRSILVRPPGQPKPPVLVTTPDDDLAIPEAQRRTLLTLGDRCKWPVGDPRSPGFFYCGGEREDPTNPKTPYCAEHMLRCFVTREAV
jgi:GcrA cell cycle regulator